VLFFGVFAANRYSAAMGRIVITCFGSLGDLHPYLALGLALRERGHDVTLATHDDYRERTRAAGLAFAPVRPHFSQFGDLDALMRDAMDARKGSEVVLHRMVMPFVRESRDDLLAAARGADLLVDHVLTLAGPLVAESLGIPRVSTVLQPFAMFSAYDPPATPAVPALNLLRWIGPLGWRGFWALGRRATRGWYRPVDALRAEMGLPPRREHPILQGASRALNLALFSRELAPPQPDWPRSTVQPGFPIHDRGPAGEGMPPALPRYLAAGEPPLVFTLGSSAVFTAGDFYVAAAGAARALGKRAVLLTGLDGINPVAGVPLLDDASASEPVVAVPYAPHSELMPRALANVHQGGVGTTAQAMLAGRPMVVVPFSHDQPDNAARCARRGIARIVRRDRVGAASLAREIGALLADPRYATRAAEVAARMRREPGTAGAADAVEALLERARGRLRCLPSASSAASAAGSGGRPATSSAPSRDRGS